MKKKEEHGILFGICYGFVWHVHTSASIANINIIQRALWSESVAFCTSHSRPWRGRRRWTEKSHQMVIKSIDHRAIQMTIYGWRNAGIVLFVTQQPRLPGPGLISYPGLVSTSVPACDCVWKLIWFSASLPFYSPSPPSLVHAVWLWHWWSNSWTDGMYHFFVGWLATGKYSAEVSFLDVCEFRMTLFSILLVVAVVAPVPNVYNSQTVLLGWTARVTHRNSFIRRWWRMDWWSYQNQSCTSLLPGPQSIISLGLSSCLIPSYMCPLSGCFLIVTTSKTAIGGTFYKFTSQLK